jgi:hypothetical protein
MQRGKARMTIFNVCPSHVKHAPQNLSRGIPCLPIAEGEALGLGQVQSESSNFNAVTVCWDNNPQANVPCKANKPTGKDNYYM